MSDIFEKALNKIGIKVNLSGDTYEEEQRYRITIALITFILGCLFLPYSAILWVVTAIKLVHYLTAKKR